MSSRVSWKKVYGIAGALLLAMSTLVILTPAHGASDKDKKDKAEGRLLYGKVLDQQENPLNESIVYLTNLRNHAVKTYIVSDGTYRFPGLTNADYEVYAQYKGRKSDTKSVSQFDDRSQVYIDLRIDTR
jgi:hypothetical protein